MKLILILFLLCFLGGCDNYVQPKLESSYDFEAPGYIPETPDSLKTKEIAIDHITLEWKDRSHGEAGFTLNKRFEPWRDFFGVYLSTFNLPPNTTEFVDSFKTTQGDRLTYNLSSYNENGSRGTILILFLITWPKVAALNYEYLDNDSIKVTWAQSKVYKNTGYEIYITYGGDWVLLDSLSADTREYMVSQYVYGISIKTLYGNWETYATDIYPHR